MKYTTQYEHSNRERPWPTQQPVIHSLPLYPPPPASEACCSLVLLSFSTLPLITLAQLYIVHTCVNSYSFVVLRCSPHLTSLACGLLGVRSVGVHLFNGDIEMFSPDGFFQHFDVKYPQVH